MTKEPRACVTLYLQEIDTIIEALGELQNHVVYPLPVGLIEKLRRMRQAVIESANVHVEALRL